jgi:hypothetical protein
MGSSNTTTNTGSTSQQTTTPTPTAEETELNRLQLEREKFLDPQIRATQSQGLALSEQLLKGDPNLPGFLSGTTGITPEITDDIVQQSLRDIAPSFQQSGLFDSGVRASVSARTAGDIRRASEEFNIGAKQNLLNLALSGQAQVQQPILGFSGQLGSRLAGLRSINQTGSTTGFSSTTSNPSTFGQIGQGIGIAGSAKFILSCVPGDTKVDTPEGRLPITEIQAGDFVIDDRSNISQVLMKHEYLEVNPDRFYTIKMSDGSSVTTCDKHKIAGIPMEDIEVGDPIDDLQVVEKYQTKIKDSRSYDILTISSTGGWMSNGIPINSMIPELHNLMKEMQEVQNG